MGGNILENFIRGTKTLSIKCEQVNECNYKDTEQRIVSSHDSLDAVGREPKTQTEEGWVVNICFVGRDLN